MGGWTDGRICGGWIWWLRWFCLFGYSDSFRKRKEFGSGTKLAKELLDLNNRTGGTYRMRDEMHKRAEANRGFAHFMR